MSTRASEPEPRPPRWPWVWLALAAAWSVAVRVPLVLNADAHLDSDLAVDGFTLLEAASGHGRWHYPGTPFTGTGPVLLSLPQALVWGATPSTLVSGGVVAAVGVLVATFLLAWRAFGPSVAAWSLVPLAFASNGAVWLSGRITGGHLTAAAWHAGAFALLAGCLRRGGAGAAAVLGLWCGLGLYLDSMFVVTLAGLIPAAAGAWLGSGAPRRGLVAAAVFAAAFAAGVAPRVVGARVEPYDAYREQFSVVTRPDVLRDHARLLLTACLPRLIAGYDLPDFRSEPDPANPNGAGTPHWREEAGLVGAGPVVLGVLLAAVAPVMLIRSSFTGPGPGRAVAAGLLVSAVATLAGFVTNRNIFNSDNYRYLVSLLVPLAVGYGLAMSRVPWPSGWRGVAARTLNVAVFAALMTWALWHWYARFGWVDARGVPVRAARADPTLAWLGAHPEVTWIEGAYWDVYRLAFLTGGRVRGAPWSSYPNRFPEWRPDPAGRSAGLFRPTPEGVRLRDAWLQSGGRVAHRARGVTVVIRP